MKLIAHRGLQSKNSRENTLEAIELGDANPYIDGVEIDVRLTKDNKVVVIHDEMIDRVSDGKGKVNEMSLERLRRFNYGSKVKPSTINTLEEVLDHFTSNTLLVIEIKNEYDKNALIASRVLEIVNKYPNLNIYIKSFEPDVVEYLKKYSNRKIGILINKSNQELLDLDMDFYSIEKNVINDQMASQLLSKNKDVMIWNVKDQKEFEALEKELNSTLDKISVISDVPLDFI